MKSADQPPIPPENAPKTGEKGPETGGIYPVVAVVICPGDDGRLPMAVQALEGAGRRLGIPVKVEAQGRSGMENELTADDIAGARGVIIAADRKVEPGRFAGKALITVSLSDGINKPEGLLRRADAGEGEICRAAPSRPGRERAGKETGLIYRHLADGVSHMLPFVTGGGVLMALALLADVGAVGADNLADLGAITRLAAFLSGVGQLAFRLMLPVLSGSIARSVAGRPGLAPGFVGGALAASGAAFVSPAGTATPAGFLGALLAGLVAGYVVLALKKLCQSLPQALEGIKSVLLYPLAGIAATGAVMCAVDPLIAMLTGALTGALEGLGGTGSLILGAAVGAMMAIDMGGPVNKTAYLFAAASLAEGGGGSPVMAAAMAGGMVPPLAIALACTFFPGLFSGEERKNGPVNYLMGLCFLTEGAIPYAAADPVRVIPACMVGSALAGGLSMAFGCTLPAPHGGVFVFPVMGNVPLYLLALLVGSVAGMALLGLLKSKRPDGTVEEAP